MSKLLLGSATTDYVNQYDRSLLFPIEREAQRSLLGIGHDALPFEGRDLWNAYEFTYLMPSGKPTCLVLQIEVPAASRLIIESKSMKLYLGSFAGSKFDDPAGVLQVIADDLSAGVGAEVLVRVCAEEDLSVRKAASGVVNLDALPVGVPEGGYDAGHLTIEGTAEAEAVFVTDLFRSLCPMTGQPDYARVWVQLIGRQLSDASLQRYLLSFREHGEFAEQVAERIFVDISKCAQPRRLGVRTEFTRRGGIDINAERQQGYSDWTYTRHYRQ